MGSIEHALPKDTTGLAAMMKAMMREPEPFLANNSGHGMLFRTFGGKLIYVVYHSEGHGPRKPQYWNVDDSGDKLVLGERIMVDENFPERHMP